MFWEDADMDSGIKIGCRNPHHAVIILKTRILSGRHLFLKLFSVSMQKHVLTLFQTQSNRQAETVGICQCWLHWCCMWQDVTWVKWGCFLIVQLTFLRIQVTCMIYVWQWPDLIYQYDCKSVFLWIICSWYWLMRHSKKFLVRLRIDVCHWHPARCTMFRFLHEETFNTGQE